MTIWGQVYAPQRRRGQALRRGSYIPNDMALQYETELARKGQEINASTMEEEAGMASSEDCCG
jgi:hypothetical protein